MVLLAVSRYWDDMGSDKMVLYRGETYCSAGQVIKMRGGGIDLILELNKMPGILNEVGSLQSFHVYAAFEERTELGDNIKK